MTTPYRAPAVQALAAVPRWQRLARVVVAAIVRRLPARMAIVLFDRRAFRRAMGGRWVVVWWMDAGWLPVTRCPCDVVVWHDLEGHVFPEPCACEVWP